MDFKSRHPILSSPINQAQAGPLKRLRGESRACGPYRQCNECSIIGNYIIGTVIGTVQVQTPPANPRLRSGSLLCKMKVLERKRMEFYCLIFEHVCVCVCACLGSCCAILVTLCDNELHFAPFSSKAKLMREPVCTG